jgi:CHAT domain-containing protein
VLALLKQPLPPALASGDLAIQRNINSATALARLGQFTPATHALDEAQKLVDENRSNLAAEVLRARGVVDVEQGELDEAQAAFRQSLELARPLKDQYLQASIQLNLGVVALQKEHYDEALEWSRAASKSAKAVDANVILEKALANEGWAYYKLGDFQRSLEDSQKALVQAEKVGSAYDQVAWLNNSGLAMYELRDYKAAESYYMRALTIAQIIQNQEEIISAHVALAFQQLQLGQNDSASAHIQKAIEVAHAMGLPDSELEPLYLRALLETNQARFDDARNTLNTVYTSPALTPSLRWEVEDAMANVYSAQNNAPEAESWYRKAISTFERQRSSLQDEETRLPFFSNANQLYRDYVDHLVRRGQVEEALQVLDASRARTLREGLSPQIAQSPTTVNVTAKNLSLPATNPTAISKAFGGVVIEYSLGQKRSYLWAITPNQVRLFELPGQAEIDNNVNQYQKAIRSSVDVLGRKEETGVWLFNKLVAPALSMIPKNARVILIPDGSLSGLNFETLLASTPTPHFWIEDVTLTTTSSLQLLRSSRPHSTETSGSSLLLIGNPHSPADEFADLPNASEEVTSVANHFSQANRKVLTRDQASPQAYSENRPGHFKYIHFVAHGTASQTSPLDSAVLLSRTPQHPDEFKLYARDIVRQPLQADLVTISTCYGSGTKSYAGEGLVGLSWAFLRAGSHNVIGALWAVSDASTPQLMDQLYRSLEKGSKPDVALRQAKLSLAHSTGIYRKPLYWGAFQLYAGS